VAKFNIIEAIEQCADLLLEFGGHPGAAGLELKNENYNAFGEKFNQIVREKIKIEELKPALQIDFEIEPEQISWELFDNLERFEPFGEGNERPLWLLKNLEIVSMRPVGNGFKHLKMELKSDKLQGKIFRAIGFGLAKNGNSELKLGDRVDIVFELIADEWNGTRNLQLKIIDFKKL
jgi:single-stranded-DNA-specific exonuclease